MLVGLYPGCDHDTIQAAIDELERRPSGSRDTLTILPGIYEENVRVYRSDLRIVGIGEVVIRGRLSARQAAADGQPLGTFGTPTLFLGGSRLAMENVTVENAAGCGDLVGQALALYAHCDETVFRHCVFLGYQDTLCTGPLPDASLAGTPFGGIPVREKRSICRQLYIGCRIEGTVDYIFGGAMAVFERCRIHARKRSGGGSIYVTAASTPACQAHGYVFRECLLTAEEGAGPLYLGRPWRDAAKTDWVGCAYGARLHPDRWDDWEKPHARATVRYREFGCRSLLEPSAGQLGNGLEDSSDKLTTDSSDTDGAYQLGSVGERDSASRSIRVHERQPAFIGEMPPIGEPILGAKPDPREFPPAGGGFGLRSDRIPAGLEADELFRDSDFLKRKGVG
ncbi:pectinesterase family protein [Paenibacillus aurantiacus]|uniref:Pectinesterase n=1 Tax=Paenibacillus aurantiacus TaxID=1936118 RepID=A0ABV5KMR5_9BACL